MYTEDKTFRVEVRPGYKDGTKIRYKGEGPQQLNTPPSDIVFIVRVKAHPNFDRDGDNLLTTVHIPLSTALCGGVMNVPTLDGRVLHQSINEITEPGAERLLKGGRYA
ncbi:hypothetical protein GEMRC1_006949 [Eukaryota sp. GEM-RC1]